mgnify:CR=1 FL=1
MARDNSTIRSQPGATGPAMEDSRIEHRKRLAQQIGRLLAHTWLGRRRAVETHSTPIDDSPPEDRATGAPTTDC